VARANFHRNPPPETQESCKARETDDFSAPPNKRRPILDSNLLKQFTFEIL